MAKVHVEYDTQSKKAKTHVDGKEVKNLYAVSLSKRGSSKGTEADPEYYLDMHQHEHDKEHDVHHSHHTMASERVPDGTKADDSPVLPDHKVVTTTKAKSAAPDHTKAVTDIVNYFSDEE